MEDWVPSSEDEDEDLNSSDVEVSSKDEESAGYEQYPEDVSTSIPVPAQIIKLITKMSLLPAQREDLHKLMDILNVKEQLARTLLIHYRWDSEIIFDAFAERGTECLFSEAGVAIRMKSRNRVVTTCNVCTEEDLQEEDTTTMDCGHTFCNVCWTQQFLIKISEGQSKRIKCMDPECNVICDEDIVRKLLSAKDPEAAQRFDRFLFESYIDDNSKVKWCPSVPSCGNAVRVEGDVYCEIQCVCGHQFCFNCLAEAHSPCSCLIWELWEKKYLGDSGNLNWITVNTKLCPKCGKNVEKSGGCNLMTCVCGQHFCWLCGGASETRHTWTTIEGHTCGRYKEDQEEGIEKVRRDLNRYTHYYSRWEAHKNSLKLETKQKELLDKQILDLESKESGLRDYTWLTDALQRLFRSRRILSYSYPYAFHMFGDDMPRDKITAKKKELNLNLFEDHQQQLEGTVERLSQIIEGTAERLSKIIEGPFDEQSVIGIKMQVIDLKVVTDSLCRKMYECIQNDLMGDLRFTDVIVPYNSMGAQMASDICS